MFRDVERLIEAGMELTPEDRLEVAEKLLESVPDDLISQAWIDEAEHRRAEWDSGLVQGIEADEAIRQLREITS
ncbi:MAG TPA: addiction module protein [Candidatus Kapabacteria bacterium]